MKIITNLHDELMAGRQVRELRSVVVDVRDQYVHGSGGIETRVTLVCHHHLQIVLTLLLPVQRYPAKDFTWDGRGKIEKGKNKQIHGKTGGVGVVSACGLPVLALIRKNFPSESRMYES